MAASLMVRYYRSPVKPELQSFDLKVVVESAVDMPKEIFIFQCGVQSPPAAQLNVPAVVDSFVCIADPVDLEEVPVNAPNMDLEMPYYRLSEVTLRFRDVETLEEVLGYIKDDIAELVDSINTAASLSLVEEVTY